MLVKQYLMNPSIFSWFTLFTPAIYEFLEKWGWFNVVKDFRFFFLHWILWHARLSPSVCPFSPWLLVSVLLFGKPFFEPHSTENTWWVLWSTHPLPEPLIIPSCWWPCPFFEATNCWWHPSFHFAGRDQMYTFYLYPFILLLLRYIVLARFCNDISQLILWICLRKGHRYELRPSFLQNLWTTMKKHINRKVLGARKLLLKHIEPYLKLFEILWTIAKIGLRRFPWQLHQNKTLSANQKMKLSSGTRIIISLQPIKF